MCGLFARNRVPPSTLKPKGLALRRTAARSACPAMPHKSPPLNASYGACVHVHVDCAPDVSAWPDYALLALSIPISSRCTRLPVRDRQALYRDGRRRRHIAARAVGLGQRAVGRRRLHHHPRGRARLLDHLLIIVGAAQVSRAQAPARRNQGSGEARRQRRRRRRRRRRRQRRQRRCGRRRPVRYRRECLPTAFVTARGGADSGARRPTQEDSPIRLPGLLAGHRQAIRREALHGRILFGCAQALSCAQALGCARGTAARATGLERAIRNDSRDRGSGGEGSGGGGGRCCSCSRCDGGSHRCR